MGIRYMIVDDTAFVRELVKAVMKSEGHLCVAEAADGFEATEMVAQTLPDLVLMDLVMPKMNGLNATKVIRDLWPEAKVVAITTMEKDALPAPGLDAFDGWIEKPFDKMQLLNEVKNLFPRESRAGAENE